VNAANLQVALVEPEIPQNTGNVGRSCVATGTPLHLVRPLGFSLADRYLRRAGLDYWPHLDLTVHEDLDAFLDERPAGRLVLTTSRGGSGLYEFGFEPGDVLVFGRESTGLPRRLLERFPAHRVTIPMTGPTRSLNLSAAAAVVLYEALRQLGGRGLPVFEPAGAPARRCEG
jgi:tRNA (cytidine/uridine-2'-O-)-methyltransferase